MRIVQVCPYDWAAPGGVQVHVRQLASHLRGLGHEVLVISPGSRALAADGVLIIGRPVPIPFNGSVAPIAPNPAVIGALKRSMTVFRPDVVHVHEPFTPSTAMYATLRADAPVIATFHANAEQSRLVSIAAPALRVVWKRIAAKVAVSNAAASFVRRYFQGDVRVVPNGVDIGLFAHVEPAELPPGRWILFVSRLEPRKGLGVALRAFKLVAERVTDARLAVVGEGRERSIADTLEPGIRDRVLFLGQVPYHDLPPYHAAADVFLAPALGGESFGYILVEAMSAGLPVVASAIPGYDEVVRDGVDGLLVPPSDPPAFAAALERVLTDPELAARLAESGQERAREFSWDRVAARLQEVYAGVLR
jgi:phosphatidylinositol alpha-mannosyltransferase